MNKEILKRIGVWILGISLFVSIMFSITTFAACMKLRAENKELGILVMNGALSEEPILKTCPICASEIKLQPVNDSFYIECDEFDDRKGCGLRTGYYKSKVKLIEEWNSIPRE